MPRKGQDTPFDISGIVGALFYVFMLHMLLPVFTSVHLHAEPQELKRLIHVRRMVQTIVHEKEHRIREMMKMVPLCMNTQRPCTHLLPPRKKSGLSMSIYWLVNYIWCYFLYIVSIIFLILSGVILGKHLSARQNAKLLTHQCAGRISVLYHQFLCSILLPVRHMGSCAGCHVLPPVGHVPAGAQRCR